MKENEDSVGYEFIASEGTGKVHFSWCEWAEMISPDLRKHFSTLHEDEINGFEAAGCCISQNVNAYTHMRNL